MDDGLTIAELAQRTGLTAQLLRTYERAGLLTDDVPQQGRNGRRRYSERDLARFRLLARLRATGMPPAEVREFAELARSESDTAQRQREVLTVHRHEVLARIAQMHEDLAYIEYQIQQFDQPRGSLRQ